MQIDLSGKVAIVTGAGRGIGREIATTLAREGVVTFATDVNPAYLDDLARVYQENAWAGGPRLCDVQDLGRITGLVDAIVRERGRVDILVNNAGVFRGGTVEEMTEEDWDLSQDINLK